LENQCIFKDTNKISYDSFRTFIDSSNTTYSALACFQVIVLARVIGNTEDEQVTLTALAIMKLADLLLST
ncbi:unnamed protein product, partial [Rotaria magnacalcarata]